MGGADAAEGFALSSIGAGFVVSASLVDLAEAVDAALGKVPCVVSFAAYAFGTGDVFDECTCLLFLPSWPAGREDILL